MAHLPRVDEALQTGIWYPFHKGLENRSWHPVLREFAQTHDAFVPDRYAISATFRASQATSPSSPLSGVPGVKALAQAISRGGLKSRINQVVSLGMKNEPAPAAKVKLTRAGKKTARTQKVGIAVHRANLPGKVVSGSAIDKVKRSLPALQRPLPDNVKLKPGARIRGGGSAGWSQMQRQVAAKAITSQALNGCGYGYGCGY